MANNSMPQQTTSETTSAANPLDTHEYVVRTAIRTIAIVASLYGMAASWQGFMTFTYFTNLSNLMICVALAGSLVFDTAAFMRARSSATNSAESDASDASSVSQSTPTVWFDSKSNAWYIFKFMMTIAIAVTFTLYLCFLAPTNKLGFIGAYMSNGCSSLCVHAIAPLLAIIDFILFDYRFRSTRAHIYFATIPPLAYVAYAVMLSEFVGVRWGTHAMRAPYNFLNYGAPAGWFGFAPQTFNATTLGVGVAYLLIVFTLIFIGVGTMFLALKDARARVTLQN
ncbi:hypothetical protein HMPREF3208_00279 [Gardnerella vaginalis]|uniref:Uncharacterized protein n=1 Tax=Gardnerella vaginalis TaxID=2702 RepID=A0A133P1M6_GARVA|nr:hypothetical protein [Gardnerella vaginalis]KXA22467.1 hypothetical protein HMPREF3208_00279 [Gardnerella vaginalis]